MKKLIVLLSLVAVVSAYPQGSVNFQNKGIVTATATVNAPVTYAAGGPMAADRVNSAASATDPATGVVYGGVSGVGTARVGLYGGSLATPSEQLVLLVPSVGFRSGTLNKGYVDVGTSAERVVPGVPAGAAAKLQIRAWDAGARQGDTEIPDTYEKAVALVSATRGVYLGQSDIIEVVLKTAPDTPPDLVDRTTGNAIGGFAMQFVVPEPSIIGLGILGGIAGLMVFRRRN